MTDSPKQNIRARSVSSYVILGAALFALIRSFSLLSPILLSFLLIVLVSLAINPLISRLRALIGGRRFTVLLVTGSFITVMLLSGWAFFEPMKESVTNLSKQLPEYWERLQKPLIKMERQAVLSEEKLQAEVAIEIARDATEEVVKEKAQDAPPEVKRKVSSPKIEPIPPQSPDDSSIRSRLGEMVQGVVGSFTMVAFNGAQILFVLVTVFVGVIFTLMNPRPIFRAMFSLVPERNHDQVLTIMQRIAKFLPGWAAATLMGMATIGLLVFVSMWCIIGFKDALILGLIAGVLEAVPYMGPILSAVPALMIALSIGGMTPVWVLFAYLAIQALENNIIQPFIMARGMSLHPLAVIFFMLLSVAAFGVLGVLIAAPMVAIVQILHDELYRKRYLPTVTDSDLDRLARIALLEKLPLKKPDM